MDIWILTALLAHFLCLAPWAFLMRHGDPYMDEIFHIPQSQKYCRGNFTEWDPKITTFPGLYLSSAAARGFTGILCSKDAL
jgi:alpha-1,2-glucosyltransferase